MSVIDRMLEVRLKELAPKIISASISLDVPQSWKDYANDKRRLRLEERRLLKKLCNRSTYNYYPAYAYVCQQLDNLTRPKDWCSRTWRLYIRINKREGY